MENEIITGIEGMKMMGSLGHPSIDDQFIFFFKKGIPTQTVKIGVKEKCFVKRSDVLDWREKNKEDFSPMQLLALESLLKEAMDIITVLKGAKTCPVK